MIAALYVQRGGAYYGIPDVDPWDVARDARLYPGPHPVVAHPPCARWCQLAAMVESKHPHLRRGDDGGTFASALASVRQWGGVIEHPAYSGAWDAHGLGKPPSGGGWVPADFVGGWTCCVEQIAYGHRARKRTWLYAVGCALPVAPMGHDKRSVRRRRGVIHDEQEPACSCPAHVSTRVKRHPRGIPRGFDRDGTLRA